MAPSREKRALKDESMPYIDLQQVVCVLEAQVQNPLRVSKNTGSKGRITLNFTTYIAGGKGKTNVKAICII